MLLKLLLLRILTGRLEALFHAWLLLLLLGVLSIILQVTAGASKVAKVPKVLKAGEVLAKNVCEVFHVYCLCYLIVGLV